MPKISPVLNEPDGDEETVRREMREIIRSHYWADELDEHTLEREAENEVEKWKQSHQR